MESFTDEYSEALLNKSWLIQNDGNRAVYLMKFSKVDEESCVAVVTDSQRCWYEVLPAKRAFRRLKECNPTDMDFEDDILQKLELSHTPGGFKDADFSVVYTADYDLALKLNFDLEWFFRWDLTRMSPNRSASILSQHLILPLMMTNHFALQNLKVAAKDEWIKTLENKASHATKALNHQLKGAVSLPLWADSLRTVTAAMHGIKLSESVEAKPKDATRQINAEASAVDEEMLHGVLSPLPSDMASENPKPKKLVRRGTSVDPVVSPAESTLPPTPQVDDMETDQVEIPQAEKDEIALDPTADDDDATEPDSDEVTSKPKTKAPSPPTLPPAEPSSDKEKPPSKKPRKAVVESSDSDAAESPKKKPPPVRQPLRRGGKKW